MILQIAGITIKTELSADQYPQTDYFKKACLAYSISESAVFDFRITIGDYGQVKSDEKALMTRNAVSYLEFDDACMVYSDSSECYIRWKEKTATLSFVPNVDQYDVLFMDHIKMLLSFLAIDRGGLPLHSSAVYNEKNGGIIFFCPSGGGKTTIASLLTPEWKILSDECNMIMPEHGTYFVYSTPFTSPVNYYLCTSGCAPLRKLFKLSKSASNGFMNLTYKEKYMSLGQSIFSIAASKNLSEKIMENMENVCRCIPLQLLSFAKNSSISTDIHHFLE